MKTPVIQNTLLDRKFNTRLYFKCENLQRGGAFKFRGACNALKVLMAETRLDGVATHSSGNHGTALALAAGLHGIPADIVVPEDAVRSKVDAIRQAGGRVHFCRPTQADREAGLARLVEQGSTPVPPYDHPLIITGQATAAWEMSEQVDTMDALITPVGGGGLLAGSALALQQRNLNDVRLFGAEPAGADDTWQSFHSGHRVSGMSPNTVSDGLRAEIGEITLPIIRRRCQDILRVTDDETLIAMRQVWEALNIIIEPSSATAVAAIAKYPEHFENRRVGIILTGGNVDLDDIPFLR